VVVGLPVSIYGVVGPPEVEVGPPAFELGAVGLPSSIKLASRLPWGTVGPLVSVYEVV
jgi:uncharacterized protein (DUF2141 family)